MRRITIAALLVLTLIGCVNPNQHGNFAPPAAVADQQQLAREAVEQLVTMLPPAKTRLDLQHTTPDPFGQALVLRLRERGYAVLEFDSATPKEKSRAASEAGLPLRYVLDQSGDPQLVRLTLLVGKRSLARLYQAREGSFVPAGYWMHKE